MLVRIALLNRQTLLRKVRGGLRNVCVSSSFEGVGGDFLLTFWECDGEMSILV